VTELILSPKTRLDMTRDRMIAEWSRTDKQKKALERELRDVDPFLEVIYVEGDVVNLPPSERGVGVVPGRWHVVRRNPKGPDAYFPIMGPNGEYRDPESAVAEGMKRADLWRNGALLELRQRQERDGKAKAAAEELAKEQRVDEVRHNYEAMKRVRGDGGIEKSFEGRRRER